MILTAVFIITPLALIALRGVHYLPACLADEEILFSVRLSCVTALLATVICLILAIPCAYALSRYKFKGKKILETLMLLPMSLPHLISGIALLLLFGQTRFGRILASCGLDFIFTVKGIVLAQIFVSLPYMISVLKTSFDSINPKIEFVARTLGCTAWQSFFRVTLPMSSQGLLAGTIMTWSKAIGEFGAVLLLAGATRMKTDVLPISIFLNISTGELDKAIATATILMIISLVSILIFQALGSNTPQEG